MRQGLLCAIPQEVEHLVRAMVRHEPVEIGRLTFHVGQIEGSPVALVQSGIGKVATAMVATLLVQRLACTGLLFSGVAGGLDPDLGIGDVVIADRVIQHDAGWIEGGRVRTYQAGHVPFFNPTDVLGWRVEDALAARARELVQDLELPPLSDVAGGSGRPPRIVLGTILSGDQYIACDATRERLHRELGGAAVEMEGGALAQVAEALECPWLVVRALSDLAGHHSHIDFGAFATEVAASSAAIVRRLLPVLRDAATRT